MPVRVDAGQGHYYYLFFFHLFILLIIIIIIIFFIITKIYIAHMPDGKINRQIE